MHACLPRSLTPEHRDDGPLVVRAVEQVGRIDVAVSQPHVDEADDDLGVAQQPQRDVLGVRHRMQVCLRACA